MKRPWILGCIFALCTAAAAPAQVNVYAGFTAVRLAKLGDNSFFYGPTAGLTADVVARTRFVLSADLRGGFYGGSRRLDEAALGPKVSFHVRSFQPYVEFLAGFARYNDGLGTPSSASTDGIINAIGGVARPINDRLDWRIFEFGYQNDYAYGGSFTPKTFTTGVFFHLKKQ